MSSPKYRIISTSDQHKMFSWYWFLDGKLKLIPQPVRWDGYRAHHFVREAMFFRNIEEYSKEQKFILCTQQEHDDIHSMSNNRFFDKYGIERSELIFLRN